MSIAATSAETVSNTWFLPLTVIRLNHAPSAAKRIPAGLCPPFRADPAVQGPSHQEGVTIPIPVDSPERPDSQPWAVSKGERPFLQK